MPEPKFAERIFAVVRRIPKGKVASYGDVAKLAGYPRGARFVGQVMRLGSAMPWWRVVGADGTIRIMNPEFRVEQVERLRKEGMAVDGEGKLDFAKHAWRPRVTKGKRMKEKG